MNRTFLKCDMMISTVDPAGIAFRDSQPDDASQKHRLEEIDYAAGPRASASLSAPLR
ncbi:MAG: hypothetical protein J6L68_05255 [Muribaculaceae bacterium]|nr:hypothetical protein [Muribaculaceae bacterium]